MRDFPPPDRSSRQVSPRRVGTLVGRQRAQPRRGDSGGQTARRRLLMGRRARAPSPDAALTRTLTHRKRLQQRGHSDRRRWLRNSSSVVWDNDKQQQHRKARQCDGWLGEHQYSNSGQVMEQTIGSPRRLMPLLMSCDYACFLATNSV